MFEKYLNSIGKYFPIQKLYATQWFSWEKIKWLLQIIWNMSWEFQRIKFKVLLNLFSIWIYLSFIQIKFLKKIKYMEIRVTWFPTTENWREIIWNHFGIFLKWLLLVFNRPVALFDLSEFVWILFNARKMFILWKIFFWKFSYIICLYKIFILFCYSVFLMFLFKKTVHAAHIYLSPTCVV